MPKCKKVFRTDDIVCSGDMTKSITIFTRVIQPPALNGVDFEEIFVKPRNVKAMIETVKGLTVFSGANIKIEVTHRFTIRYIPDVTFEKYIMYSDQKYAIIDVENQNERNKFYILRCTNRGLANLPVAEI